MTIDECLDKLSANRQTDRLAATHTHTCEELNKLFCACASLRKLHDYQGDGLLF